MELMDIASFVDPANMILIVFVWCLGLFFKRAPWFDDEWKIPFILLVISIIFSVLKVSFTPDMVLNGELIVMAIIQGVIIAALAVFGNETLKQLLVKRKDDQNRRDRYRW